MYGPEMGNEQVAEFFSGIYGRFVPEASITAAEHGSHGLLGVSGNEGVVKLPQLSIQSRYELERDGMSFLHTCKHPAPFSQRLQDKLYHS